MEKENTHEEWLLLLEGTMTEMQIAKGLLNTNGISAKLQYEAIGKIYGFTVDGLGKVKLYIKGSQYTQAKSLINSLEKERD